MVNPAAFRRLCVETFLSAVGFGIKIQPPLGGCVLKPYFGYEKARIARAQPPLGGCVLKLKYGYFYYVLTQQPPLGGCVLKPFHLERAARRRGTAAFRRLCVETHR